MLVEQVETESIWPPIAIDRAGQDGRTGVVGGKGAFRFVRHGDLVRFGCVLQFAADLALGAEAPENDFGFIDEKAVGLVGLQAGRVPNGAVDIDSGVAESAHEVVMVITNACFVKGWSTGGLDAADDFGSDEGVEVVEDGLSGEGGEDFGRFFDNGVGVEVGAGLIQRLEDGEAGLGQTQASLAEANLKAFGTHSPSISHYLD